MSSKMKVYPLPGVKRPRYSESSADNPIDTQARPSTKKADAEPEELRLDPTPPDRAARLTNTYVQADFKNDAHFVSTMIEIFLGWYTASSLHAIEARAGEMKDKFDPNKRLSSFRFTLDDEKLSAEHKFVCRRFLLYLLLCWSLSFQHNDEAIADSDAYAKFYPVNKPSALHVNCARATQDYLVKWLVASMMGEASSKVPVKELWLDTKVDNKEIVTGVQGAQKAFFNLYSLRMFDMPRDLNSEEEDVLRQAISVYGTSEAGNQVEGFEDFLKVMRELADIIYVYWRDELREMLEKRSELCDKI